MTDPTGHVAGPLGAVLAAEQELAMLEAMWAMPSYMPAYVSRAVIRYGATTSELGLYRPKPTTSAGGGGGEFGEYASLLFVATTSMVAVTAFGLTLELLVDVEQCVIGNAMGVGVCAPVDVPVEDPKEAPEEDPEDPPPPPPPPDDECAPQMSLPPSYEPLDAWGRAVGGHATLLASHPGGEVATKNPKGYAEGNSAIGSIAKSSNSFERGHLVGKQLGGQNDLRNLTPLWRYANSPTMRDIENDVAAALESCYPLQYDVKVEYSATQTSPGDLPDAWRDYVPARVFISAHGRRLNRDCMILNEKVPTKVCGI